MAIYIENENFGYAVTTWADHAVVGNPDLLLYSVYSASYHTGSVAVYKYDTSADAHTLITTLYGKSNPGVLLLAAESGSGPGAGSVVSGSLRTEQNGLVRRTDFMDLLIDEGNYLLKEDDGFGCSVDLWDDTLAVGCKHYHHLVTIGSFTDRTSGSYVDVYNLDKLDPPPYTREVVVEAIGSHTSGSQVYETASIPPNYDAVYVLFTDTLPMAYDSRQVIDVIYPPVGGGLIYYARPTSAPSGSLAYRCGFDSEPLTTTLTNPHEQITSSFGHKVAVNENWLAVSTPEFDNARGAVCLYQKSTNSTFTTSSNNYVSWSLYQVISSSTSLPEDRFGWSIGLNKQSGSYSGSLIIGTARASSSIAHLFEFIPSTLSWSETYQFRPSAGEQYLTFYNSVPIASASGVNAADGYGSAVAIWDNTFVIGAPTDRIIYEYSGSSLYHQGAVYIYETCTDRSVGCKLMLKSYGNEKILKNNRLGFSVDVHDGKVIAGSPKTNALTTCYVQGTLTTNAMFLDGEDGVNGQFAYFQRNTSSTDWSLVNIYQTKKNYLSPYTKYGYDVAVHDKFVVVGSPLFLSTNTRLVDASGYSSTELDAISGKSYIYNFNNFHSQFYVGNVFYRNGLLVINTSGSSFENLFLDNRNSLDYQYSLDYRSKQTMYETQYICPIEPGEFNVSTNPTAITKSAVAFDMNGNGTFDFQDADVLLKYMQYQNTKFSAGGATNNWSQSLSYDDGERSFLQWSSDRYVGTDMLFSASFDHIDSTLKTTLDINSDQKIDLNDMYILWKYFSNRLTQRNYEKYITPMSQRTLYSDVLDYLNVQTGRGELPQIKPEFLNYAANSRNDPTGSYLAPYVTSVGLYSGTDLVAIAKLGNPVKIVPDFPHCFVLKLDF
jgi:hypothetical protein